VAAKNKLIPDVSYSGGKYVNTIKLTMLEKISLILKMGIGSAISWELAILFGSKYPYLGPISLVICLQATLIQSIRFGMNCRYNYWSIIRVHSRIFSTCERLVNNGYHAR